MTRASVRVESSHHRAVARYRIDALLAVGGMGVIYRAYDRVAQREVAYKRLRIEDEALRPRFTTLFQREYDTLASLPHPNIVRVYDYGEDELGPYYVMELLSGQDLTDLAPLPVVDACRLLRDLASALALLHSRRLIHRDLSPNNVRLTEEGHAKLLDFGALTPFGYARELVGTPPFMAPECLSESELDQRSDLYALGALAYWTLTRRLAVQARTVDALVKAIDAPIEPPSLYAPAIPRELDQLVLSLLARDRQARPESAAEVIDRLTTIGQLDEEHDERKVAHSYLAEPRLVGREPMLRELRLAVDAAREGHGRALVIKAPAGLGRSALLRAAARNAQLEGATVLEAKVERGAGAFAVARKLTHQAFALYPDLDDFLSGKDSFQSYTPSALPKAAKSPAEAALRHAEVVTGVQGVLLELSRRTPVVIVIDDLHDADAESISLLLALAEVASTHALSLLVSCAASASGESTQLAKLEALAGRLTPSPLSAGEVGELVQALFGNVPNSHRLADWLFQQSGGSPANALDLARLLLSRAIVRYSLGTFTVPHDVGLDLSSEDITSVMLARLGDLDADAHEVARLLSLQQHALSTEQIAAALSRTPREVALALDALTGRAVVARESQTFWLTSSSLRLALEQTLGEEQRKELHVRLARALLAYPDGTLEQRFAACMHLVRGGADDEAAELLTDTNKVLLHGQIAARWTSLLEAVLAVYRRQKRSPELCLSVMVPLVFSGFYGGIAAHRRHLDATLESLARVCGVQLAARLRPFLGGKLALVIGLVYAGVRRAMTPARERLGTLPEMITALLGAVISGVASAASSLDGATGPRVVKHLEPFSALPEHNPAYLLREYAIATAELGAGLRMKARRRYIQMLPRLRSPIPGLHDESRVQVYLGCLNGSAQTSADNANHETLALADELAQDPFYAPHAECARVTYYGYRGQREAAERHRKQAEALALRNGTSWSAVVPLTARLASIAVLTDDAIGLMQAIAEFERLSVHSPNLATQKQLCEAWLSYLRGRPEQAVEQFARVLETDEARRLTTYLAERVQYAAVLNASGKHALAKEQCVAVIAALREDGEESRATRRAHAQLALAEAGLGNATHARELAEHELGAAGDNPLARGGAERLCVEIALVSGDASYFALHHAAMSEAYRRTGIPALIQKCETLLDEARRLGLAAKSASARPDHKPAVHELEDGTVVEQFESGAERPHERAV